jgi:hypothetical protein
VKNEDYESTFGSCSTTPANCGKFTVPAAEYTLTLLATESQPGIGGGKIYTFAAMDSAGSWRNYRFIDGNYGCGYDVYVLISDGSWSWMTEIDFVK